MPKWLIIQSDGEHKGQDGWTPNFYLRECYAIQHALSVNGIDADIWGKRHNNFDETPDFNKYDVLFILEQYEMDWLPDLSTLKPTKLQWCIDLHCHSGYEAITPHVDIVLHSTKALISPYKQKFPGKKHIWFPNGVDSRFFHRQKYEPKITDLMFVGSRNPNRNETIETLEKFGMKCFFATGQDMINLINSAKIHFNKNISCDVNYRNFETIGIGTCLLTNESEEIKELGFIDGVNCLFYKTAEEAIGKVKNNISTGSWLEIQDNGCEFAKQHSYIQRIKEMLKCA